MDHACLGSTGPARIWRDLNQVGISQANELSTLEQAGIASVGVSDCWFDLAA